MKQKLQQLTSIENAISVLENFYEIITPQVADRDQTILLKGGKSMRRTIPP